MVGLVSESVVANGVMVIVFFISTMLTGVLLTLVFRELYKMSKRNITSEEKQVKQATKYLVLIVILYYLCLLPAQYLSP